MKTKKILGIEIGNLHLKIAVMNGSHLEQMVVCDLPENLVQDAEIVSWDAMGEFIREVIKAEKISVKSVSLAIPEKQVYAKRVEMPLMTVDQLKVNLPYEFHDYITEDKDRYFYDYAVIGRNFDESGEQEYLDLMAVAVQKDLVAKYKTLFRRAGLKLELIAPDFSAFKRIIKASGVQPEVDQLGLPAAKKDFAVLDLGHATSRLFFFPEGEYEIARVMDIGGDRIDQYIEDTQQVGIHTARLYKESNKDNILYDPNCMELYSEMAIEVMRVLNFYNFNHPGNSLDTLYCCGGGALVPPLLDSIRAVTEVRVASLLELLPEYESYDNPDSVLVGHLALGITVE